MKTTFGFDIRVLLCTQCGAPLEASAQEGALSCGYCGQQDQLRARSTRTLAPASRAPLAETDRLQRLRAQDGKPLYAPPEVAPLMEGGQLPERNIDAAVGLWQQYRRQLAAGDETDERQDAFFTLTLILANAYAQRRELLRQRAMYESALEVFSSPRHQQGMRGFLATAAAREGDILAAEAWLAPCDQASDDLPTDTAYRLARAMIDTAHGDWQAVLRVLGDNPTDIPIMDAMDAAATVYRANACEQLGELERALWLLTEHMVSASRTRREAVDKVVSNCLPLVLCAQSLPVAHERYLAHAADKAARREGGGIASVFLVLALASLAASSVMLTLSLTHLAQLWLQSIVAGVAGLVLLSIWRSTHQLAQRAADLRAAGLAAQGRVIGVAETNLLRNDVPVYRITVDVERGAQPTYRAALELTMEAEDAVKLVAGSLLPLRIDPRDPQHVVYEAD